MLQTTFLFINLFSSPKITPTRLYNFGFVVLAALKAANDKKQFDAIIEALTPVLTALFKELKEIDKGVSGRKIDTRTVDELIVDFYRCMSENEGVIAKALDGKKSAGYLTFYPNRQSEYSKATKTNMPLLTERVADAAVAYADKLDADLVKELQSFAPLFTEKYGMQQLQMVSVEKDRKERGEAFLAAQKVLTSAVYTVGAAYPDNPEKCHSFFPFGMLRPKSRRKRYTLSATLAASEDKEVVNYVLNKTAYMICTNKSANARYALWLAASPKEPMPADAFVMNANEAPLTIKAGKLGNLQDKPFIMVRNLSDLNACAYEITFVGVKKAIKGAVETEEGDSVEIQAVS